MKAPRTRQATSNLRMPPALRYGGAGKVVTKKRSSSKTAMAAKLRMREWLEQMMNSGECKGISWVNQDEKIFQISWCHAARNDFDTQQHADIFFKYAEFTGKNKMADGTKEYNSKLKSNFRSALNSLVDCIVIKNEEAGKIKGENAVKTFQFIDPSHPEYKRKKLLKAKNQRKGKNGGKTRAKEAAKEEPQSLSDSDLDLSYPSPVDENILLTDEAEAFIQSTNPPLALDPVFDPPTIPPLPTVLSESAGSGLSFQPTVDRSSLGFRSSLGNFEAAGNNREVEAMVGATDNDDGDDYIDDNQDDNGNGNSHSGVLLDVIEFSAPKEEDQPAHAPSLPNFPVLGVNDTFDTPICHAHKMLNSGGNMRVRKEKRKLEPESFPLVTNFTPQPSGVQRSIAQSAQPVPYSVFKAVEEATLFPGTVAQDTQVDDFQEQIYFDGNPGFGHVIAHNEAVTVIRQDPETVSQGENYNLLDIGSMHSL